MLLKKIICALLIIQLFSVKLYCNTPKDKNELLFSELINCNTYKEKIDILHKMASIIRYESPLKAIRYLEYAIEIKDARENIKDINLIKIYYLLGEILYSNNKMSESLIYLNKCIEICTYYNSQTIIKAMSLERIASIHNLFGETNKAKQSIKKAIKILSYEKKDKLLARCYNILGNNYYQLGDLPKAISSYRNSYTLDSLILIPLINLASCYTNYQRQDSALKYLHLCKTLIKDGSPPSVKTLYLDTHAFFYYTTKDYIKSIKYLKESILLATKFKLFSRMIYSTELLSTCYEESGNYIFALKYLKKTLILKNQAKKIINYEAFPISKTKSRKTIINTLILTLILLLLILELLLMRIIYFKWELRNFNDIKNKNNLLLKKVEFRKQQELKLAFELKEKDKVLYQIQEQIRNINKLTTSNNPKITELTHFIKEKNQNKRINLDSEKELLDQNFYFKLSENYPKLSANEKKLALYIRLNYSSKEIANTLNISSRSVNMNRYRLRKKLNLKQEDKLDVFLKQI